MSSGMFVTIVIVTAILCIVFAGGWMDKND